MDTSDSDGTHPLTQQQLLTSNGIADGTDATPRTIRQDSEQSLSAIVKQAMVGFARGLSDGTLTFVNNKYCEMLGYEEHELLGKRMQDFTHPDDRGRNMELYVNLVKTGQPFVIEKRYVRKDGAVIWVHNSVSALRDERGRIEQIMAVSTDISDRKKAEDALKHSEQVYRELTIELEARVAERTRQLEASVNGLKQSNENLQQFAYIASHDLQEPLRKILQFGDRLRRGQGEPAANTHFYLDRMLSAASRMSTLINDLLNFSKISNGTDQAEWLSLETLISEVLTTLEFAINDKGAQVTMDSLPLVFGDRLQLGQAFQNIISNGLKFSKADTPPVIHISAENITHDNLPNWAQMVKPSPHYHLIRIADNGIGFDEQFLDRIFKMFHRLNGKSQYEGTGIGLAICAKVVANHGGAITASSQPGAGATFSILLPEISDRAVTPGRS